MICADQATSIRNNFKLVSAPFTLQFNQPQLADKLPSRSLTHIHHQISLLPQLRICSPHSLQIFDVAPDIFSLSCSQSWSHRSAGVSSLFKWKIRLATIEDHSLTPSGSAEGSATRGGAGKWHTVHLWNPHNSTPRGQLNIGPRHQKSDVSLENQEQPTLYSHSDHSNQSLLPNTKEPEFNTEANFKPHREDKIKSEADTAALPQKRKLIEPVCPNTMPDLELGLRVKHAESDRSRITQQNSTPPRTGIGPALSPVNSDSSSILGSDIGDHPPEEWGPQHPCYPHLNPHVPLSSPLFQSTRIIRIQRDWMIEGDLAPTFSNLYPEILDPVGVSEQEFRRLVECVNKELVPAFSPWNWRNIFDGVLCLITGWLWDDAGLSEIKARLCRVEKLLEKWNKDLEIKVQGEIEEGAVPRAVPLRRTGYMSIDIQVPNPEIPASRD